MTNSLFILEQMQCLIGWSLLPEAAMPWTKVVLADVSKSLQMLLLAVSLCTFITGGLEQENGWDLVSVQCDWVRFHICWFRHDTTVIAAFWKQRIASYKAPHHYMCDVETLISTHTLSLHALRDVKSVTITCKSDGESTVQTQWSCQGTGDRVHIMNADNEPNCVICLLISRFQIKCELSHRWLLQTPQSQTNKTPQQHLCLFALAAANPHFPYPQLSA